MRWADVHNWSDFCEFVQDIFCCTTASNVVAPGPESQQTHLEQPAMTPKNTAYFLTFDSNNNPVTSKFIPSLVDNYKAHNNRRTQSLPHTDMRHTGVQAGELQNSFDSYGTDYYNKSYLKYENHTFIFNGKGNNIATQTKELTL
jgi:hypothetical protein